MTMDEFLKLDYGSVVVNKRYPEEVYEIYDTDAFGEGYRGREYCVLGAIEKNTEKAIRIDKGNFKYWDVVQNTKKEEKNMLSEMDSAADIRIYNYKTGTVNTEKGVIIYDKSTLDIKCFGNECADTFDRIWNSKDYAQDVPISIGKIYEYKAAVMLIKWMIGKYVDRVDGKLRIFKRSKRALIYLHEPMSTVDLRMYMNLMRFLHYRDIYIISANGDHKMYCENIHVIGTEKFLAGRTPEEAIRKAEEVYGKLDCAIEITKDRHLEYARYAYETFKKDCERWGIDPTEIID